MGKVGKICLGLILLATVGLVVYKGRHRAAQTAEPVSFPILPSETSRVNDATTPPRSPVGGHEVHVYKSESSDSPPVKWADIPAGIFRRQLESLPLSARVLAFETLSETQVLPADAKSLRVDQQGGVFFVCSLGGESAPLDASEEEPVLERKVEALVAEGASVPISSPPIRHSRPGAVKVLFLDFNGHVVSGTRWNSNIDYGPTASWDCRPYSTDDDETTFSSSEQANIIQIWERVAEDFAPFNVDVTTEEPLVWGRYKGHALITPTTDKDGKHCPHYGFGGIAYLNVYGEPRYSYDYGGEPRSPAWVKAMSMANIAEAISHELGHNLGLSHDGTSSKIYYGGHDNESISWGPIMGTGYGRNVSQWSKGEYFDSNQSQDDLQIIQTKLSYRIDDHGDNNESASVLGANAMGVIIQSGVIERTGNPDVFSFSTGFGVVNIEATPYRAASSTWGGNLDLSLELYDSSGALIASNNPTLQVTAELSEELNPGVYFLHVKPVGVGVPLQNPPRGYTVYGSLGQYWISGAVSGDADDDGMPNEWEALYFGNFTNAVASGDLDDDGADNLSEYIAGTLPNNSTSVFEITSFVVPVSNGAPFIVNWSTAEGRLYSVGHSDNLILSFPPTYLPDAIDLPDTQNSYTDTVERTSLQGFYRVDVRRDL